MESNAITLRMVAQDDVTVLAEILRDDIVKQTYMVSDLTKEASVTLAQRIAQLSEDPSRYVRGIYLRDGLIGLVNDVGIEGGFVELGWAVHPKHHNRGYATQALRLAIQELFAKGYSAVTAGAFSENAASIRVMEKAGMLRQHKTEQITYRDETHECIYYAIRRNL